MNDLVAPRPAQQSVKSPAKPPFASSKITSLHLALDAGLYVRQSSLGQVRDHQESAARQYQLAGRLNALGWPDHKVQIIDDDQGISGNGKSERPGFRRLLQLVTEKKVGIVLGLEMSRLARNSKDWHDLYELCATYNVLIADEDGIFDPHDPNDRLVLGLKGIISELELHTMRVRLERGRLNKAARGELFSDVPVGYIRDGSEGLPQFDPDASARHAIKMFFAAFESQGSANRLFHYLAKNAIKLPFRDTQGQLQWRVPAKTTVYSMLRHPLYAGTYGYGRKGPQVDENTGKTREIFLPPEQWTVCLPDRFDAYITWQQYQQNVLRLHDNRQVTGRPGAPRGGSALLGGIIFCGHCGRRMSPVYDRNLTGSYACVRHQSTISREPCGSSIAATTLDRCVEAKLLEALSPGAIALSLRVVEDEVTRRAEMETLYVHRLQQAQYAEGLSQRRYQGVDPENRLVVSTLEKQWETALSEVEVARDHLQQLQESQPTKLNDADRHALHAAARDVVRLWTTEATIAERKEITRLLLARVEVEVHNRSERVSVHLHWRGGFESCDEINRPLTRFQQLERYDELQCRALALAMAGKRNGEIAETLEQEGFRSPRLGKRLSTAQVQKLLSADRCRQQLHDPVLRADHWRCEDLALALGVPAKRLKQWVGRGWVTAQQRPVGRAWVLYADAEELERLRRLVGSHQGQGSRCPPKSLTTAAPIPEEGH